MPLGTAVQTARDFVAAVYYVYLLCILVYILLSWIRLPYSIWGERVQRFLYDVVNPYLALFRRALPFARLGMFDFSPIIAIFALSVIWRLIDFGIEQLS
jgi:YggT family protein